MKSRILLAAALTFGSTGLSLLTGTPAAQAQQACNWYPSTSGHATWGDATMDGPYNSYNLYTGNASTCDRTGYTVAEGAAVKVICHEKNNAGNEWAYIQNGAGHRGWVSRSNISSWWPTVSNC
ncbi:SH3 domain-containing protein [Nocardia jejuensis]|uniref:SH3 domain-containing protein n=1 Tax=Nocardia jejuensis TaxID=328049 RepID=UPI0008313500|nr:SH3 domain-containing protein [Nocardia jejuensis]